MNKRIRDNLNAAVQSTSSFFRNLGQTIISISRMLVLSSPRIALKSRSYISLRTSDTCTVLGNGPSLKMALDSKEVQLDGNDVYAVNMFCLSEYFTTIRPRFYFLIDAALFAPKTDRHRVMVKKLIEKFNAVSWEMYLVISSSALSGGLLKEIKNPNVKVLHMNSTTFEGFKTVSHFFFRHRLAMPRCQTVVNFALATGIVMGYKTILLYGADHSWTRDLFVDDNNVVCYGDRHVYNTGLTVVKKEGTIGRLLHAFANMFDSHWVIREYADSMKCKILNCTKDSFVDAYDRIKS